MAIYVEEVGSSLRLGYQLSTASRTGHLQTNSSRLPSPRGRRAFASGNGRKCVLLAASLAWLNRESNYGCDRIQCLCHGSAAFKVKK